MALPLVQSPPRAQRANERRDVRAFCKNSSIPANCEMLPKMMHDAPTMQDSTELAPRILWQAILEIS